MNTTLLEGLLLKGLNKEITFPEILATLKNEAIEAYHVDFLRNEARYYAKNGESFITPVSFVHDGVAGQFSAEVLGDINKRVQMGTAGYADFVREGTASGCAYYIVYVNGKMVRYFGRDGGEHVQFLPGSR